MKGSRGVSRPPRQARSGVTYKESDDDDDDEEFIPSARLPSSDVVGRRSSLRNSLVEGEELGITKGKRTLTLKRARTVEPHTRAEKQNLHVHWMLEAVPEEKPAVSPDPGSHFHQVVESAEGVLNSHRESTAFDYLLEAVSGASGDSEEEDGSIGQHLNVPKTAGRSECREDQEKEMTSAAYGPDLLAAYATFERTLLAVKGVDAEDTEGTNVLGRSALSSDEETSFGNSITGTGIKKTVESETDMKSEQAGESFADEKKYIRRGQREKQITTSSADGQTGKQEVEEERLERVSCASGKKNSKKSEEDEQDTVPSAFGKKDGKNSEEDKQGTVPSANEMEDCKNSEEEQGTVPSANEMEDCKNSVEEKQDSAPSTNGANDNKDSEEEKQENLTAANGKKDSKGDKNKQENMSSAEEDEGDIEAEDSWNESSEASDAENKRPAAEKSNDSAAAKKRSQEMKPFVKKTKVPRKDASSPAHDLLPAKSSSVPPLLPKKRPALWVGSKPFVPPGPLNLQTPIVAHRRVVGLSRRHRPPPLHPYLLGS